MLKRLLRSKISNKNKNFKKIIFHFIKIIFCQKLELIIDRNDIARFKTEIKDSDKQSSDG